jgi:hypothetical protein
MSIYLKSFMELDPPVQVTSTDLACRTHCPRVDRKPLNALFVFRTVGKRQAYGFAIKQCGTAVCKTPHTAVSGRIVLCDEIWCMRQSVRCDWMLTMVCKVVEDGGVRPTRLGGGRACSYVFV